jgi:hypothetical protein
MLPLATTLEILCTTPEYCTDYLRSWRSVLNTALCDKSVSVTCGRSMVFSEYSGFPPPIKKTNSHDITEILLKVALNTITLTLQSIAGFKLTTLVLIGTNLTLY